MRLSNTTICFASDRTGNYEIYVMDLVNNLPVQLTDHPLYDSWWPRISPDRVTNRPFGARLDPSPSADSTEIVFSGLPNGVTFDTPANRELLRISALGGPVSRLTIDGVNANDPYVSPDGSRVAWLFCVDWAVNWGLGRWALGLTRPDHPSATTIIDDGHANSRGVWTKDGKWLFFHRLLLGQKWDVYKITPEGTELTPITTWQPGNNVYPSV
jgi:Tol biopolymer transport system component